MTHKYTSRRAYIIFHKTFLTFERFFMIRQFKYIFIFLLDFYCDMLIRQFSTSGLKKTEETFLNFAYMKVSYL
jgi:hypothetical protein